MRTVEVLSIRVMLMSDIPDHGMVERFQNYYPDNCYDIVEMLDIYISWRIRQLSDGQRRHVHIPIGPIRPFKLHLLDEIMTSLDVCVR